MAKASAAVGMENSAFAVHRPVRITLPPSCGNQLTVNLIAIHERILFKITASASTHRHAGRSLPSDCAVTIRAAASPGSAVLVTVGKIIRCRTLCWYAELFHKAAVNRCLCVHLVNLVLIKVSMPSAMLGVLATGNMRIATERA